MSTNTNPRSSTDCLRGQCHLTPGRLPHGAPLDLGGILAGRRMTIDSSRATVAAGG